MNFLRSARSFINRVIKVKDATPREQVELEEEFSKQQDRLQAMIKQWKNMRQRYRATIEAMEKVAHEMKLFADDTRDVLAEPHSLLFANTQSELVKQMKHFDEYIIGTMLAKLDEARTALDGVKSYRNLCRSAFSRQEELRARLNALSNKHQMDQIQAANATQHDLHEASDAYELALVEFSHSLTDYKVAQTASVILASSEFMTKQREHYSRLHTQFRGVEPALINLGDAIDERLCQHEVVQNENMDEAERLRSVHAIHEDMMNRDIYDTVLSHFRVPEHGAQLVDGEKLILSVENVLRLSNKRYIPGMLEITDFRIVFTPYQPGPSAASSDLAVIQHIGVVDPEVECIDVPMSCVSRVTDLSRGSSVTSASSIMVSCKDLRTATFSVQHSPIQVQQVEQLISKYAFGPPESMFAFRYQPRISVGDDFGWDVFASEHGTKTEFERLGFPNEAFVISDANRNFEYCPTYPMLLVVPTDRRDLALGSAGFRSKRRLPALTWSSVNSKGEGVGLFRCSQPLPGVGRNRSPDDENYLRQLACLASGKSQGAVKLAVVDCRPKANALGNVAKGGGWENTAFYSGEYGAARVDCTLDFLNIENIHVVRESFVKLRGLFLLISEQLAGKDRDEDPTAAAGSATNGTATNGTASGWRYQSVMDSLTSGKLTWFKHLSSVLVGAQRVATRLLTESSNVVIHCSDGWDRTAQISALSQLIGDPYYRTMYGFGVLVEKDWVAFGHKFAQRFGQGANAAKHNDSQRSPVFVQFVDAVYQLVRKVPDAFEFKPAFLVELVEALYSGRFGTFFGNCERERLQHKVQQKTRSVWTHLLDPKRHSSFSNPSYADHAAVGYCAEYSSFTQQLLTVDVTPGALSLFTALYKRWDEGRPGRLGRSPPQHRKSARLGSANRSPPRGQKKAIPPPPPKKKLVPPPPKVAPPALPANKKVPPPRPSDPPPGKKPPPPVRKSSGPKRPPPKDPPASAMSPSNDKRKSAWRADRRGSIPPAKAPPPPPAASAHTAPNQAGVTAHGTRAGRLGSLPPEHAPPPPPTTSSTHARPTNFHTRTARVGTVGVRSSPKARPKPKSRPRRAVTSRGSGSTRPGKLKLLWPPPQDD